MVRSFLVGQAASWITLIGKATLRKLPPQDRQDRGRFERTAQDEQTRHDKPPDQFFTKKRSQLEKIHRCKPSILGIGCWVTQRGKGHQATELVIKSQNQEIPVTQINVLSVLCIQLNRIVCWNPVLHKFWRCFVHYIECLQIPNHQNHPLQATLCQRIIYLLLIGQSSHQALRLQDSPVMLWQVGPASSGTQVAGRDLVGVIDDKVETV